MPHHPTPLESSILDEGVIDECADEINELVARLGYSPEVLALALRRHLAALLEALLEADRCTAPEISAFARALEREALQSQSAP